MLSDRIKELRELKGLTQKDLAKMIGIKNPSNISLYETGDRKPSFEAVKKMAQIFGVSLDYLLDEEKAIHNGKSANQVLIMSQDDIELLNKIKALSDNDKKIIVYLIDKMILGGD